jgi:serine/threonine protein kinase
MDFTEEDDQPPFIEVDVIGKGAFELGGKLGEGGQASVYLARELSDTRRPVAVKVVECRMADLHKGSPSVIKRFQSEVRTWNQFASSSYVVKLFYTFRYRARDVAFFCFVMEYAELGDLSKNLQNRSLFSPRRKDLLVFLRHLALAIKEGHNKDITHGDIKPHNVLLFKGDGKIIPKVMDFGLGISTSEDVTKFGGTPEYLAPERFGPGDGEGEFVIPENVEDAKLSDVYSLGVLFFEIVSGQRPYQAPREGGDKARWAKYRDLHASGRADFDLLAPNGGADLVDLVRRMMAVDPTNRPSLVEVIRRFDRMVQDASTMTAREQECPVGLRTYRWNPEVHRTLESRLYYYFVKGRTPEGDPKWFKNHLEDAGIRFFSFYNILGGYDYVLRLWARSNKAEEVDRIVSMFKSHQRTDFLKFAVSSPSPFGFDGEIEPLPYQDETSLLAAIESCSDSDKEKEFANLKAKRFVGSRLSEYPSDSIRFFLTISVAGSINGALLRMYSSEILKQLIKRTSAKQTSVYIGTGAFQLLLKFRLMRFQDFRHIFGVFRETCEYVRVGDSVLNSQTFVELDERGLFESDDGSIVNDLVRRIEPDE